MNKKLLALLLITPLVGCVAPDYKRLIPENKDADIEIFSAQYGHVKISTRVNPQGTNPLPPLSNSSNVEMTIRPIPLK